ncbi:MAG: thioredoxin family protein [Deltaproteobacteria bacterium]|nr:thioredoxin family protein [Deltaproteobacteria bacterium]
MTRHPAAVLRRGASLGLSLASLLLSPAALAEPQADAFTRALGRGPLYAAGAALVGGFLVSLTPCVYPMIAITVSVFGARQSKSRGQGLLLSTAFVAGIVAMFVPLGVVAGLTGSVFGSLLSHRWVNVGIGLLFLALAASMFGAFEMVLPERVMQRLAAVGGIGYGGAFLLGLVSGIVAAPCTGPVLTGILVWIGKTQSAALGATAMLAFSVGLGIPFWLVGAFAVSLPKSGRWMMGVKSFFGVVMIVAALYFIKLGFPALVRYASASNLLLAGAAGATVLGLLLGAVHLDWSDGGWPTKLRKGAGIGLMAAGGFCLVASLQAAPPCPADAAAGTEKVPLLTFLHAEAEATAKAKAERRPLLVDFTADWCIACGKLDRTTFADPRVRRRVGGFVAVKIDVSVSPDLPEPEQEKLEEQFERTKKKYGVVGLPTIVVYDSTGKERVRITDYIGPDDFLKRIAEIE